MAPPPAFIRINNHGELPDLLVKRVRYSDISDEDRSGMTHVCRGAEYVTCSAADLPHDEPSGTGCWQCEGKGCPDCQPPQQVSRAEPT